MNKNKLKKNKKRIFEEKGLSNLIYKAEEECGKLNLNIDVIGYKDLIKEASNNKI